MNNIYKEIYSAFCSKKSLLGVLLDPEKINPDTFDSLLLKIKNSPATHVLIGGSTYHGDSICDWIKLLKINLTIPVIIFPGDYKQVSEQADGLLFLSLLSGNNPDFLIGQQIAAVPKLIHTNIEIISTGYILVNGGKQSAVEKVSKTNPIDRTNFEYAAQVAKAGEYLGNKLIYLEAGSGAAKSVSNEMIAKVSKTISIPLIVGGGISSRKACEEAFENGATMVIIGTAFENDYSFFEKW